MKQEVIYRTTVKHSVGDNVRLPVNDQGDVMIPVPRKDSYSLADATEALKRMVRRSEMGLCGAEFCGNTPTDNGVLNPSGDKVAIFLCEQHLAEARIAHHADEYPTTILTFDGETQH